MTKTLAIVFSTVCSVALVFVAYFAFWTDGKHACSTSAVAGGKALIGGSFTLVDHTGVTRTDEDIIDGLTLIYFGFTFCPDVCPLDNARNLEAVDLLDAEGIDVTPVFISIDPARDTPEALADYVEVSHERLIGLTGSDAQVAAASKAYRTFYSKSGEGEDYLMNHSTFSYLVDQSGFIEFFRRDVSPESMAKTIECYANV